MKRLFKNPYIMLYLSTFILPLSLGVPQTTFANPAGDLESQCLAEVREVMVREKIEQLPEETQKLVDQHCQKSNVDEATKLVMYTRCEMDFTTHIKKNKLNVTRDIIDHARRECHRGNPKKAIEVIGVASTDESAEPAMVTPEIIRFHAEPHTIRSGVKSELYWEVYDADQITLTVCALAGCDKGSTVPAKGPQIVTPKRTTNYTLKAKRGDKIVEDHVKVHVSPFPRPQLSPPFKSVELCQKIDESGDSFRCVSPDGPFYKGKKIHVILRFTSLAKGKHRLHLVGYSKGVTGSNKWKENFKKSPIISNPKTGSIEASFEIPNSGQEMRKLELIIDHKPNTKNHIEFCVECPGHDEW